MSMSAEELLTNAGSLRRGNPVYMSNVLLTKPQLETKLSEGAKVLQTDDAALLFEDEECLLRLSFWARDEASLGEALRRIKRHGKAVITDVVGRDPSAEELADAVARCGFALYSKFVRMTCRHPKIAAPTDVTVCRAKPGEEHAIIEMLQGEFDPLFSHIPRESEIADAVREGEIGVIRDDRKMAGLAYFERTSEVCRVLRYLLVDTAYRGRHYGAALLADGFGTMSPKTTCTLWVGTYNRTQTLYERIGFQRDGTVDYIMKLKGED